MKYFATFICLFLLVGNTLAQVNLVPNGGFEEFDGCPTSWHQLDSCSYWFIPSPVCTPDYYHACATGVSYWISIPDPDCHDYPYEGDGVVRVGLYDGGGEPISVKLIDTLDQGGIYQFSMKLQRRCSSAATGSVGVLFTDTVPLIEGYCDSILITPQLRRNPSDIMSQFSWYTYTDTLYATGGETYMTITNFDHEPDFILADYQPWHTAAMYWVDDVSLIRIGTVGIIQPNLAIKLTSELVSEQLDITTDKPVQLNLMDISGRMVLSKQLNSGRSLINVSSIPNGMYVAVFSTENGQTTSRKIVKAN